MSVAPSFGPPLIFFNFHDTSSTPNWTSMKLWIAQTTFINTEKQENKIEWSRADFGGIKKDYRRGRREVVEIQAKNQGKV